MGLLAVSACNHSGSGGGSSPPDTTPPTVTSTYPPDIATGVFVDGAISATFSEPMDFTTIDPTSFFLMNGTTPVSTSVGYAGNTATLTPVTPSLLARTTVYNATVTTGVTDLAGNALAADYTWSFTTETDAWQTTSTANVPTGRIKHSAVWTGSKMIVWGGRDSNGVTSSGGLYDPVADTWSATTLTNAPASRLGHTAVWTGSKMIVWGGWDGLINYFNNGNAFDPTSGWNTVPIATPNGFAGRWDHTAVWTGSEMIVWGGNTSTGLTNTGAAYNPSTDKWRLLPSSSLTERAEHSAVWTGTEMIVWGGNTALGPVNTGAAYDPTTDTWRAIANPPPGFLGRANHTAVWTGTEMIVWGGNTSVGATNTGAAYNPVTNTWRPISSIGAPEARFNHTAIWPGPTGIAMVIWGGTDLSNYFSDGGRYDPVNDIWRTTEDQTNTVPTGRFDQTAVWTGSKMIVWGGNGGTLLTNSGGRYAP